MASNMQASIIEFLCANENYVKKTKNWMNGNKEMKDTSLVASKCEGDFRKFLENLPKVEIIMILVSLVKDLEGEVWNDFPQDSENHDAGRGHHGHSNLKDVSMEEKEVQDQPVAGVESHAKIACPEDLGSQDATDRSHQGHSSLRDVSKEKEVGEYFANQHQPAATDTGYDASEGQAKHKQHRDRQPWEFPPREIQALTQQKDSKNHGLPLESAFNNENKDSESDNTTSSSESIIRLDEESFDSKGTSVNSGTDDRQLGSTTPIEACADDNRKILRASEHAQTLEPGSRFCHSELHNACRRSRVQDVQAQLPEQPNLQNLHVFELLVPQLVETVCNNSKVALAQASRETQNVDIQGTSCSNCNAIQEENYQLEDEVLTLNEKSEQMQEQIAELEESLSNQDYEIRILKQQKQQLLMQFALCEETIKSLHEDKKDEKKITDFLIARNKKWKKELNLANKRAFESNKKWKEELNLVNKRAFEFAQKTEEEMDALLKTMKGTTKDIEEVKRKAMAVEEENKMLKAKIKEWKERWKEREKDEKRVLQGQRCLRQELSALQYRLGLRFFADDVKDIEKVKRKVMAEKEEQGRRSLRQELSALQYRLRLRFLTDDVEENNFNRQQDDDVVD